MFNQSSYGLREEGKDWTGNSVYLSAIRARSTCRCSGQKASARCGELIIARAHYAASGIGALKGVSVTWPSGFFKEFVVDFSRTGMSVAKINKALLKRGIFGGKDLSKDFPALGQSALYAITECHSADDIDRLANALKEIL